ncbi:hypothetical protein MRB53_021603 [Persea americana]|uniref:Uncharacterized protein n=1 Tax=Persea americana TaxID=3435 RepID=A0ACC2L532_PERAE|nr:hypothetical protein MRB53_021603 [Persea americana]
MGEDGDSGDFSTRRGGAQPEKLKPSSSPVCFFFHGNNAELRRQQRQPPYTHKTGDSNCCFDFLLFRSVSLQIPKIRVVLFFHGNSVGGATSPVKARRQRQQPKLWFSSSSPVSAQERNSSFPVNTNRNKDAFVLLFCCRNKPSISSPPRSRNRTTMGGGEASSEGTRRGDVFLSFYLRSHALKRREERDCSGFGFYKTSRSSRSTPNLSRSPLGAKHWYRADGELASARHKA